MQDRAARGDRSVAAAEDHRRRARGGELRQIAGIRDERQIARLRVLDAGHAYDLHVAVAVETAVEPRGNLVELQSGYYALKKRGAATPRSDRRRQRAAAD